MPEHDHFDGRLVAAMEKRSISVAGVVAAFAEQGARVTERTVTRWRQGHSVPGAEAIPLLARILAVPSGWLLGEGDGAVPEAARV